MTETRKHFEKMYIDDRVREKWSSAQKINFGFCNSSGRKFYARSDGAREKFQKKISATIGC